jgi:hypothetical protein
VGFRVLLYTDYKENKMRILEMWISLFLATVFIVKDKIEKTITKPEEKQLKHGYWDEEGYWRMVP